MSNTLDFGDAATFVAFFDEGIREGRYGMYPWQSKILYEATSREYTEKDPYKASIAAVNGSGKDRMIISGLAAFFAACYNKALIVITSASGKQIDEQTKPYIKSFCTEINKFAGAEIFDIKDRSVTCLTTGSRIVLFATDEAGKAEGWHPLDPGAKFILIVNEAKSVSEEIFRALYRCTGFTHRIDISSPGMQDGHFYKMHMSGRWNTYKITAFDCPHLGEKFASDVEFEYGKTSPLYRSMVECEFGTEDAQVVITLEALLKCKNAVHGIELTDTAGVDLSAGGDETVVAIRNGNKITNLHCFRTNSTSIILKRLEDIFAKHKLSAIYADAGGLGKPIIDELSRRGYSMLHYVYNNGTPHDTKAYFDRGTELYFNLSHLVTDGLVILPEDQKLRSQLTTREYIGVDGERVKLVPKKKLSTSPDRADAVVLAFANYSYRQHTRVFSKERQIRGSVPKEIMPTIRGMLSVGKVNPRYQQHDYNRIERLLKDLGL